MDPEPCAEAAPLRSDTKGRGHLQSAAPIHSLDSVSCGPPQPRRPLGRSPWPFPFQATDPATFAPSWLRPAGLEPLTREDPHSWGQGRACHSRAQGLARLFQRLSTAAAVVQAKRSNRVVAHATGWLLARAGAVVSRGGRHGAPPDDGPPQLAWPVADVGDAGDIVASRTHFVSLADVAQPVGSRHSIEGGTRLPRAFSCRSRLCGCLCRRPCPACARALHPGPRRGRTRHRHAGHARGLRDGARGTGPRRGVPIGRGGAAFPGHQRRLTVLSRTCHARRAGGPCVDARSLSWTESRRLLLRGHRARRAEGAAAPDGGVARHGYVAFRHPFRSLPTGCRTREPCAGVVLHLRCGGTAD